jgi:hypothetical protein
VRLRLGSCLLLGSLILAGCGARGLKDNPSTTSVSPAPSAVPTTSAAQPPGSGGDIRNDNTVLVNAGSETAGVNIVVTPAADTENAQALGKSSDGFAANTGTIVHQASTSTIVLFGPGISGAMSVMISGPNDIGVNNLRAVQAKDGTPGLAFDAVIGSSSAPGARSVYLKAPNNDITAFVGGLEVMP